jgi:hypothetical protein
MSEQEVDRLKNPPELSDRIALCVFIGIVAFSASRACSSSSAITDYTQNLVSVIEAWD